MMSPVLTAVGIQWWLALIKFILAIFFAFYIPGSLVLPLKVAKSSLTKITLSLTVGVVLLGWQEFIFGYLSWRNLSYAYLIFFSFLYLLKAIRSFSQKKLAFV